MKIGITNASGGKSIEHNDTLNQNSNPNFLHATQSQHDRWDDTYTKSEVEQIKLELLNLIYAGL